MFKERDKVQIWSKVYDAMNDQPQAGESTPDLDSSKAAASSAPAASIGQAATGPGELAAGAEPAKPKVLTPEEQMALFEADLKENDWGHQPC